ncbi:hypothetical protein E8E13_005336 [Curvularia kusanoi]|uniref:Uncharacterized protein n=1 Tax=Curvularia kusanoi TaxID=90978 RepID=A0A9P4TG72_CURKU|nr:hypothetical protein E8E13_005336 [Curvularia kusanoi]
MKEEKRACPSASESNHGRLYEQTGYASHTGEQPWCPLSTAFDSASTAPRLTEDDIPTRPVTPRTTKTGMDNESAIDDTTWEDDAATIQAKWNARLQLSLEKEREKEKQWKKKQTRRHICGVCSIDYTTASPEERVAHFNYCWHKNRGATPRHDGTEDHQQDSEDESISDETISEVGVEAPTDSIEELPSITRPDPSTCALCSDSLVSLSDLDAFHHRYVCWDDTKPLRCPVCLVDFSNVFDREEYTMEDILWHVHNCQHGGSLSVIDKDDFDNLLSRWRGRMHAVWRFYRADNGRGPGRENWTSRSHDRSYRRKKEQGHQFSLTMYVIPQTTLRRVELYDELGELKVIKRVESNLRARGHVENFRKSAFTIPGPNSSFKVLKRNKHIDEPGYDARYEKGVRKSSANANTVGEDFDASMLFGDSEDDGEGDEERGRPRTRSCTSSRRSRSTSHGTTRLEAVENAKKAGLRIPPGFEL